jgi:hypothetical protein
MPLSKKILPFPRALERFVIQNMDPYGEATNSRFEGMSALYLVNYMKNYSGKELRSKSNFKRLRAHK